MDSLPLPLNPHDASDLLLSVLPPPPPTPVLPTAGECIAFERVSLREDFSSLFIKALCARHVPQPTHVAFSKRRQADRPTDSEPPPLPVDFSRPETSLPQGATAARPLLPRAFPPNVLTKTIYKPHGRWAWTAGLSFYETAPRVTLSSGAMCSAFIKTGKIGDRPVKYVSKVWLTKEKWHGFFSELALYKIQLKTLQGRVVPSIINVYAGLGAIDVAMEPPHRSFWVEASGDMPYVLKKRCVKAFEQLHAAGVLHGDVELRHMLIGGDARVTIIDFQESRALVPNAAVQLKAATPAEFRKEMRQVKFKLNFENARDWEDEKMMRSMQLERRNRNRKAREIEAPLEEDVRDPPIHPSEWNDEWFVARPDPVRFVMPGQSAADIECAVEEFLSILEKLEEEEACRDGAASNLALRSPSPEFKFPVVPAKQSMTPPSSSGLGAPVTLPPQSQLQARKRKGECERPQDEHKRIRIDANLPPEPRTLRRPPAKSRNPPLIVTRLSTAPVAALHAVSETPSSDSEGKAAPPSSPTLPRPSPPGKRKRTLEVETYEGDIDLRGRHKMRKLLSDVSCADAASPDEDSSSSCCIISAGSSTETNPAPSTLFDAELKNAATVRTFPAIFRWIETLWRVVS